MTGKSPQDYLNPHNRRWDDLDFLLDTGDTNYVFQNAQAEAYYNALVTAQGDELWINSLYSISINAYKQGLDNLFISGATDGWLARLKYWYLFQGSVGLANIINAVNVGTNNATAFYSPTYGIN